jgi:hypothetical protein
MTAKKHRKSAFVPRLLVRTAVVGVVPACAIASASGACGADQGSVAFLAYDASQECRGFGCTSDDSSALDASRDSFDGVAAVAYPPYESGIPSDASPSDGLLSVADTAYPSDANTDGGSDARPDSRFFGVAAVAYPAYEAGNG